MAENRFKARQQQRAAAEQERLEQAMGTASVPAAKQETDLLQCHMDKELKGEIQGVLCSAWIENERCADRPGDRVSEREGSIVR